MTLSQERDGSAECSDPVAVYVHSRTRHVDERAGSPERRVMTDGGQAEVTAEDESKESDDTESTADDDAASESAADDEAGSASSAEADEGDDPDAEALEEQTEETDEGEEAKEGETDEVEDDSEDTAEPEPVATEAETDVGKEEAPEEEAPEEEDEYHVEDAEDVYQDDEVSGVLHLDLDGLFLDLLGLEVNLNPVTLDVSARPGENNLLGNLLSAVTGLLDGAGGLSDAVSSLLGKPKELLTSLLSKPRELLSRLFGRGGDEAEAETAETADEEPDAETAETEEEAEAPDESGGRIAAAGSWLKEKLLGLIPGFPIEDLVATIVSQVIEQLIKQLEPDREQAESDAQSEAASQAEA